MNSRILTLLLVLIAVVYTGCNKENTAIANHPETMAARSKTEGSQFLTPAELVSGKYVVSGDNSGTGFNSIGNVSIINDTLNITKYDDTTIVYTANNTGELGTMFINNFQLSYHAHCTTNQLNNAGVHADTTLCDNYNFFLAKTTETAFYFSKNQADSIYISLSDWTCSYSYTLTLTGVKIK